MRSRSRASRPAATPQTLGRGQRLTSSALFRETMDCGHVFRAASFVLFCQFSRSSDAPQVGFFAGRRLGGAVARNRAKRRLREAYRRLRHRVGEAGVRLVFQARREAGLLPFPELTMEMEKVLTRVGVLPPLEGEEQA